MFDITIVAAVTVQDGQAFTVSHVFRLDLDGDRPEDIAAFMGYIREYDGVAHTERLVAE